MDTPADEQPPAFKPRHTIAQKALLTINVVIVLACIVGAVVLLYGKAQLDRRLQVEQFVVNTSVLSTAPASTLVGDTTIVPTGGTFPPADPAAKNFLITGSDANACVDPHSQWSGAADPARDNIGMRSDTIMVMRVDPASHQAAVLSFPRDLWLKIPGRSDNRINTAYVERDNLTSRQSNGRLVRKTLSHSKRKDYLQFHIDFEDAIYNFVRPHSGLRLRLRRPGPHGRLWTARTPAMAAGLTDHIWSLDELLS